MEKFTGNSKRLLKYVGDRESIAVVSHCIIRMRFVLNDPSKADTQAIGNLANTKGIFIQAERSQVIAGNEASASYNNPAEVAGVEGISKDTVKKAAMQNQTLLQKAMSNLAETFASLIPTITVGGLILGFRNIIGEIALSDDGAKTLIQISILWAGVDSFLRLIGEAILHSLPVCIIWSITKKMGTTQAPEIALGITLVSPQLLDAHNVAATVAAEIPKRDFGLLRVDMIEYQVQALPTVLAGSTLVYLEWFSRKVCSAIISMIVVPFCSLMTSVAVAHDILGPTGWKISAAVSDCVNTGLTSPFKGVFAGIFGFSYAPLVITGFYHVSNAIDLQLIADFRGITLWPMIALPNIAQGSAVLAMILLQRNSTKAKEVSVLACTSCYLGVTEPAMFGMNLRYGFPFICGMTGSAVGAILSVVSGIKASAIGVGGIPGILSIQPQYMGFFAAAMGLVILIPFCLTYTIGGKKGIGGNQDGR